MNKPEFTISQIRAFSAKEFRSVSARMVTSLLGQYDIQLDDFLSFLVKEGYCDSDVYHQEIPVIDQFLSTKNQ